MNRYRIVYGISFTRAETIELEAETEEEAAVKFWEMVDKRSPELSEFFPDSLFEKWNDVTLDVELDWIEDFEQ